MRAFKTVNDSYIEPISFIVPRRAEVFQGDIYPPVTGTKPAMSAAGWFDGKEGLPSKIDLESVYAGEEPAEVPSDYKPASQAPPPTKVSSPPTKEPEIVKESTPPPSALRGPPPSMKEQTSSIANIASKFADNDDAESSDDDDDTSSFEEVSKPVDRSERNPPVVQAPHEKTESKAISKTLDDVSETPAKPTPVVPGPAPQTSPLQSRVSHRPLNHRTLQIHQTNSSRPSPIPPVIYGPSPHHKQLHHQYLPPRPQLR